jgi:predicted SnoaL-like aldol condensation-catalyzing enzyme
MSQTTQEKNKALLLEAFDTLFNKRDYAAAERYWSPHYIQHSAHIEPGSRWPVQSHQEHPAHTEI